MSKEKTSLGGAQVPIPESEQREAGGRGQGGGTQAGSVDRLKALAIPI